jgi:N6-L-threonylcarbamoyladenine synthase
MEALPLDGEIIAVGASSKPRENEDSYMPCFLAGSTQARVTARALNVPCRFFSHQQGHIAAAAWSAGKLELLDREMLAWHLSGGTTELLYVCPDKTAVQCRIVGRTTDVSAGQLIDRTGVLLGLKFPAGKALDALAKQAQNRDKYDPKLNGLDFSLSGVEHKMKQMLEKGAPGSDAAYFALSSVVSTVKRVTARAKDKFGDLPVLFSGGVASNSLLRESINDGIFADGRFSTDNAMGTAILTYRAVKNGE